MKRITDENEKKLYKSKWDFSEDEKNIAEANLEDIPEPVSTHSEQLEALLDVLEEGGESCLTEAQKNVFQLCAKEGRSLEEAADILGITKASVHDRLQLAAKKLRKLCLKKLSE